VPPGFLCAGDTRFADDMTRLSPVSGAPVDLAEVARAVDRINVAGLCDPSKRNWYGVDLEDAVRASVKLGATADEVRRVAAPLS
jgi:hypothetical protein